MKRSILIVLIVLSLGLLGASQTQIERSLRNEVRKQGFAWRISYSDYFFLATLEDLIRQSDLIVRGRVVDEKARFSRDERTVWTDYTIEVLEIFKDPQQLATAGDRVVVTKRGGNVLVEEKPVRVDTPSFPPVPWVAPHVFLITRWKGVDADGQYGFTGGPLGVWGSMNGKVVCDTRRKSGHRITKPFCDKSEPEFLRTLKEKIAAVEAASPAS